MGIGLTGEWLDDKDHIFRQAPTVDQHQDMLYHNYAYAAGTMASGVADGAISQMLLITGEREVRARFYGVCEGSALGYLIEAPTILASGTAISVWNFNRKLGHSGLAPNDNPSQCLAFHTPTCGAEDLGNPIMGEFLPAGSYGYAFGGGADSFAELVLRPETAYVLRIRNVSGGAKYVSMGIGWVEMPA